MGLLFPLCIIYLFNYILGKTYFIEENTTHSFKFLGKNKEGYIVILTSLILSILTLGLYLPFAYGRVLNWFVNNTRLGEKALPSNGFE